MRLAVPLALFAWIAVLLSGLLAVVADLEGAAVAALALADLSVGGVLVLVAVRLTMPGFHRGRRELIAAFLGPLLGALVGTVGGVAFALGIFLPYAAGWGGHEMDDFGGSDYTWQEWLAVWLRALALVGAAGGAVCGLAAWVLRFAHPSWHMRAVIHWD